MSIDEVFVFRSYFLSFIFLTMSIPNAGFAELYHTNDYQIEVNQQADFQTISLDGEFGFLTSMKPARLAIQELIPNKSTILIIKKSNGGYLAKFQDFIKDLKSICSTENLNSSCRLVTYATGLCNSACIDIFVQGDFRIADDHAIFGFHRLWVITPGFSIQSNTAMMDKFIKYGADPDWFKKQTHIFQSKDNSISQLSGYDMVEAKMADQMIRSVNWHQTVLNYFSQVETQ